MKDAVSRILVELLKRIWPQLWPDMFHTLYDICQHGVESFQFMFLLLMPLFRLICYLSCLENPPVFSITYFTGL